ncbi:glycosyltransferase [Candidatus Omnitrophota bacterium]
MENKKAKILLMSHCVPPVLRGPSVIINRLFRRFPEKSYVVLSSRAKGKKLPLDSDLRLPCKYYYADIETIAGGSKSAVFAILQRWVETFFIIAKGVSVCKRERCERIVVVPNHGNFLLAAYVISKVCGKKLYVYFFDIFSENKKGFSWFDIRLRVATEALALWSAVRAFVMSERLEEYYRNRYPGLSVTVLRHSIDRTIYDGGPRRAECGITGAKKIVFTGMIYEYQIDAVQNLARAVQGLDNMEVHIYSQRSKKYLKSAEVTGKNIFCSGFVPNRDLMSIQREADVLFLPMSFHAAGTDANVIRTASPSKISEYLAAGRPILVHAPSDSYVAWYARKHEFALIVDKDDSDMLRDAIIELSRNEPLRKRLVSNAQRTVGLHDASKVSGDLMNALGVGVA